MITELQYQNAFVKLVSTSWIENEIRYQVSWIENEIQFNLPELDTNEFIEILTKRIMEITKDENFSWEKMFRWISTQWYVEDEAMFRFGIPELDTDEFIEVLVSKLNEE